MTSLTRPAGPMKEIFGAFLNVALGLGKYLLVSVFYIGFVYGVVYTLVNLDRVLGGHLGTFFFWAVFAGLGALAVLSGMIGVDEMARPAKLVWLVGLVGLAWVLGREPNWTILVRAWKTLEELGSLAAVSLVVILLIWGLAALVQRMFGVPSSEPAHPLGYRTENRHHHEGKYLYEKLYSKRFDLVFRITALAFWVLVAVVIIRSIYFWE